MCSSKFIVYIVLVFKLLIEYPVVGTGQLRNLSTFDGLKPIETNCDALRSKRSFLQGRTMLNEFQRQSSTIQKKLSYRSVLARTSNTSDDDEFRFLVTGGYRPEKNELVKFVVSIRTVKENWLFGDNHFCGGSIISEKIILTAAHCMFVGGNRVRASRVMIAAGTPRRLLKTSNTQEVMAEKIIPHPKYSGSRLVNDIGLIKLKQKLKTDDSFVAVIPINDKDPSAGTLCTVVGWGTVIQYGPSPDEAVNGDVSINTNRYCSNIRGFAKGMICASNANNYEVDSCQGDSGGPLICQGKVVGIVSFGYGCGEPDSAGVYTDVYYFRDWIRRNVACSFTLQFATWFKFQLIILAVHIFSLN